VCDDALMRINCWHEVGRRNASKDVVRIRRISAETLKELRVAIRSARDGRGDGVLFTLERGYSSRGRACARFAVGVGVVIAMLAGVGAFLAPDASGALLGLFLAPAVVVVASTAVFSYTYDTGVKIRADGILHSEGWSGIRELDLASFARVTLAVDSPCSDDSPIGG
jgi:hypothetical protein